MSEPFLGEIIMFAGNFAPRGWAFCQGQLMSIAQNTALFSILGTTFGGDGRTTFALPDLRGRVPVGNGQGPGLSPYTLGELAGNESVTLITTQIPAHNHTLGASTNNSDKPSPAGAILAVGVDSQGGNGANFTQTAANTTMAPAAVGMAGGSQPHENRQPYLVVNFIIALQGIFPSRN